ETLGEDRSRIRKANSPFVMATLRNLSIGIIRLAGETNIASGLRHFAWSHKTNTLRVIGV
ncbi:MAG: ISAs1 family transposase, partial [Proteobacteria bacterium]|nr:ISAs1 family transposase [Pseudomonadota bacterium]